jgi:hypothetical protein
VPWHSSSSGVRAVAQRVIDLPVLLVYDFLVQAHRPFFLAGLLAQLVEDWTDLVRKFCAEKAHGINFPIKGRLVDKAPEIVSQLNAASVRSELAIASYRTPALGRFSLVIPGG